VNATGDEPDLMKKGRENHSRGDSLTYDVITQRVYGFAIERRLVDHLSDYRSESSQHEYEKRGASPRRAALFIVYRGGES
jgi:hypothetical protein